MRIKFRYIINDIDISVKQKQIARINLMLKKQQISPQQYCDELVYIANQPNVLRELKYRGEANEEIISVTVRKMHKKNGDEYKDRCELTINGSVYIALINYEDASKMTGGKVVNGYID